MSIVNEWSAIRDNLAQLGATQQDMEEARQKFAASIPQKAKAAGLDDVQTQSAVKAFDAFTQDGLTEDERWGVDNPIKGGLKQAGKEMYTALAQGAGRLVGGAARLYNDIGDNDKGTFADNLANAMDADYERLDEEAGLGYQHADGVRGFAKMMAQNIPQLALSYAPLVALKGVAALRGAKAAATAVKAGASVQVANAAKAAAIANTIKKGSLAAKAASVGLNVVGEYGDVSHTVAQKLKQDTVEDLRNSAEYGAEFKALERDYYQQGLSAEEASQKAKEYLLDNIRERRADVGAAVNTALEWIAPNAISGINKLAGAKAGGELTERAVADAIGNKRFSWGSKQEFANLGMQIVQEGTQEGFTEYLGEDARANVHNDTVDWGSVAKSAALGAAGGGIMGHGIHTFTTGGHQAGRAKVLQQLEAVSTGYQSATQAVADGQAALAALTARQGSLSAAEIATKQQLEQDIALNQQVATAYATQLEAAGALSLLSPQANPSGEDAPVGEAMAATMTQADSELKAMAERGDTPDFEAMAQHYGVGPDDLAKSYDRHQKRIELKNTVAEHLKQGETEAAQAVMNQAGMTQEEADAILDEAIRGKAQPKQPKQPPADTPLTALSELLSKKPDADFATEVLPFLKKNHKVTSTSEALALWNEARKVTQQNKQVAEDEQAFQQANAQLEADAKRKAQAQQQAKEQGIKQDALTEQQQLENTLADFAAENDTDSMLALLEGYEQKEADKLFNQAFKTVESRAKEAEKAAKAQEADAAKQAQAKQQQDAFTADMATLYATNPDATFNDWRAVGKKHGVTSAMELATAWNEARKTPPADTQQATPKEPLALPAPESVMVTDAQGNVVPTTEGNVPKKPLNSDFTVPSGLNVDVSNAANTQRDRGAGSYSGAALSHPIVRTDGKPFETEQKANQALKNRAKKPRKPKEQPISEETHHVAPIEGGFAIVPKGEAEQQLTPQEPEAAQAIDELSGDYTHSQFPDAQATVSKTAKGYDINWGDEVESFTGKNAVEKTKAALAREKFNKKKPDQEGEGGITVDPTPNKPVSPSNTTQTPKTTGEQIAEAFDKTAKAITEASHAKVVERVKNGEEIVYKQPAAIERAKQDDRYQVEINDKGHAVVKNVKDNDGNWVKQDNPVAAESSHIDNGKIEEVTGEVIRESLAKVDDKPIGGKTIDLKEAKQWLLDKANKALNEATIDDISNSLRKEIDYGSAVFGGNSDAALEREKKRLEKNKSVYEKLEKEIGYVTFDVPNDGTFRVLKTKKSLERFIKKVQSNKGFAENKKQSASSDVADKSPESVVKDFFSDRELENAYEYSKLKGKPMRFGKPYEDKIPAYALTESFDVHGVEFFVGLSTEKEKTGANVYGYKWRVIEPKSGLAIGASQNTKKEAITEAKKALTKHVVDTNVKASIAREVDSTIYVGESEREQKWLAKNNIKIDEQFNEKSNSKKSVEDLAKAAAIEKLYDLALGAAKATQIKVDRDKNKPVDFVANTLAEKWEKAINGDAKAIKDIRDYFVNNKSVPNMTKSHIIIFEGLTDQDFQGKTYEYVASKFDEYINSFGDVNTNDDLQNTSNTTDKDGFDTASVKFSKARSGLAYQTEGLSPDQAKALLANHPVLKDALPLIDIVDSEQSIPDDVLRSMGIYRVDAKDFDYSAEKPHGLYVSIPDDVKKPFDSPHDDTGDTAFSGYASPEKPLIVENLNVQHARGRGYPIPASAGIAALANLTSKEEFDSLLAKSKAELIALIAKQYPAIDTSKYHDAYELLEVLGAQKAKENGYDAIILKEGDDPFNEMVILDHSIIDTFGEVEARFSNRLAEGRGGISPLLDSESGVTEGYFHKGRITLFANNIHPYLGLSAEERLIWVAFHEITHRGVAALSESKAYLAALEQAAKNRFIKNLASEIQAQRAAMGEPISESVAIEEAIAEANAALQSGNASHIKNQYGLHFPKGIQPTARNAVQRFFEAVRAIIHRVFGRGLTDAQLGNLLRVTQQAGMSQSVGNDYEAAVYSIASDSGKPTTAQVAEAKRQLDEQLALADQMIATQGQLLAPNGKPSKLNRVQWAQVRTDNFKKWFGDWESDPANASKLVDKETGEPAVFYHGTRSEELNQFNEKYGGIYLTQDLADAEAIFTQHGQGDALHLWANARNPFDARWHSMTPSQKEWLRKRVNDLFSPEEVEAAAAAMDVAIEDAEPFEVFTDGEIYHFYGRQGQNDVIEMLRKAGHDAVIFPDHLSLGEPHVSVVVFESTQIKSATDNIGTFDPKNPDIRFSRKAKESTEQNLIITHNLSPENLLHAVKMGGLAVPSLAITTKDEALTGFGSITLIGRKEMADPKGYAKTKAFGADIYSPRYPQVERTIDAKGYALLEKRTQAMSDELGINLVPAMDLGTDGYNELERSPVFLGQFLKDNNIKPAVVWRESMKPERSARLREFGLEPFMGETDFFDLKNDEAFRKAGLAEILDRYSESGKYEFFIKKIETDKNTQNSLLSDLAREITNAAKLAMHPEVERYATLKAMMEQIENASLRGQYVQAVNDILEAITKEERIFQGRTSSGNRRYIPHTLENVVKLLKKNLRGGEGVNYGVGSLRALFTPQFNSVDAIRNAKDRLVSAERFEQLKNEINKEFQDVVNAISPDLGMSAVSGILAESVDIGIRPAFKNHGYDISDDAAAEAQAFIDKLRVMPTEYFEAKILRSVDLSEFVGAVVPDNLSDAAMKALRTSGITDIRTYTEQDEKSRKEAIQAFTNDNRETALFSLKDVHQRQSHAPHAKNSTAAQVRAKLVKHFGEKIISLLEKKGILKIHQSLNDESVPKEALRQTAYHGSPFKFDKFSLEHLGRGEGAQAYGWGLYFAGKKATAEWYRKKLSEPLHSDYIWFKGNHYDITDPTESNNFVNELVSYYGTKRRVAAGAILKLRENNGLVGLSLQELRNKDNKTTEEQDIYLVLMLISIEENNKPVGGQLYDVNIPEDDNMLLWDKPLSEQPKAVKRSLQSLIDAYEDLGLSTSDIRASIQFNETGEAFYRLLTRRTGSQRNASIDLKDNGIIGIKYLDGSSRSDGDGTYNYVVFDDTAVQILKTYYSVQQGATEGFYLNGTVHLIADNLTDNTIIGTFVHELGGHKGFQEMMSPAAYALIMERFNRLVEANNPIAVAAKQRAEEAETDKARQESEYLPYLITEQSRVQATTRQRNAVQRLIDHMVRAVKGWVVRTLSKYDTTYSMSRRVAESLTPADILYMAERMVGEVAKTDGFDTASVKFSKAEQSQFEQLLKQADAMIAKHGKLLAPNGQPSKLNRYQWAQVRTDNFKKWFGDWENDARKEQRGYDPRGTIGVSTEADPRTGGNAGRVWRLDSDTGEPKTFFHGTKDDIEAFDLNHPNRKDIGWLGRGIYVASDVRLANAYANLKNGNHAANIMPLFVAVKNPLVVKPDKKKELQFAPQEDADLVTQRAKERGHDGVVTQFPDGTIELVAFHPTQIKSAMGNNGEFSPTNPDIRFSKKSNTNTSIEIPTNPERSTTQQSAKNIKDLAKWAAEGLINTWVYRIGTKLDIALKNPRYKRVFDLVQAHLNHVNVEAYKAIEAAPDLLGRLDTFADYKKRLKLLVPLSGNFDERNKNIDAVAKVVFDGTLIDKKEFSEAELRAKGLTDDQITLYKQARAAINISLNNAAKAEMTRELLMAEVIGEQVARVITDRELTMDEHKRALLTKLDEKYQALKAKREATTGKKAKAALEQQMQDLVEVIKSLHRVTKEANRLTATGYAPLMRYGDYTASIYDDKGELVDFRMFETKSARDEFVTALAGLNLNMAQFNADKATYDDAAAKAHKGFKVIAGTMNNSQFEQFKGVTPEVMALFADKGSMKQSEAYQAYLKLAVSNNSAFKRLIHRKGMAGYSEDLQRVVASFVMSNARRSAKNIYNKLENAAVNAIPKEQGYLQEDAQKLVNYINNPEEEAQGFRNILFMWNLGASVTFGLVNLTQPFLVTIPKLSEYTTASDAKSKVLAAAGEAFTATKEGKAPKGFEEEYEQARREGHLDPQGAFVLAGIERGNTGLSSSYWQSLSHGMGLIAQVTESMNRKTVFIAAMQIGQELQKAGKLKAQGFDSPYDFAIRIIQETQGTYNKGNRGNFARGAIGTVLMMFKQYPIMLVQLMGRMAVNPHYAGEKDKYRKALLLMLALLWGVAGLTGLPGVRDIFDVAETALALGDKPTNIEREIQIGLGKDAADWLMNGAANNILPFDIKGRMGMGDLIPTTSLMNPVTMSAMGSSQNKEMMQVLGAGGGFVQKMIDGSSALGRGDYRNAAANLAPRAIESAVKGIEMGLTGVYTDRKGNKVRDVSQWDALMKFLDMNPSVIAKDSRTRGLEARDAMIQGYVARNFKEDALDALAENDMAKMDKVDKAIEKWNRENPRYPVEINTRALHRKLLNKSKTWQGRNEPPKGMEWWEQYR